MKELLRATGNKLYSTSLLGWYYDRAAGGPSPGRRTVLGGKGSITDRKVAKD